MSKTKPIDTSSGTKAYLLAVAHKAALDPRLPAGTVSNLAADLTTLGANPTPTPIVEPATPPPTLAEALATAVSMITAVHEAVLGTDPKPEVRKAYGTGVKTQGKDAEAVVAMGQKIVDRVQLEPTEALGLGILPGDVAALVQAMTELGVAEATAKGKTSGGATSKERRAAEDRMHVAVARIAGAGVLAFAKDAGVRAEFEGLKEKK